MIGYKWFHLANLYCDIITSQGMESGDHQWRNGVGLGICERGIQCNCQGYQCISEALYESAHRRVDHRVVR